MAHCDSGLIQNSSRLLSFKEYFVRLYGQISARKGQKLDLLSTNSARLVKDIQNLSRYVNLDPQEEPYLAFIPRQALDLKLPKGWTVSKDKRGYMIWEHKVTGEVHHVHPLDAVVQEMIQQVRATFKGKKITETTYCWVDLIKYTGEFEFYNFATNQYSQVFPDDLLNLVWNDEKIPTAMSSKDSKYDLSVIRAFCEGRLEKMTFESDAVVASLFPLDIDHPTAYPTDLIDRIRLERMVRTRYILKIQAVWRGSRGRRQLSAAISHVKSSLEEQKKRRKAKARKDAKASISRIVTRDLDGDFNPENNILVNGSLRERPGQSDPVWVWTAATRLLMHGLCSRCRLGIISTCTECEDVREVLDIMKRLGRIAKTCNNWSSEIHTIDPEIFTRRLMIVFAKPGSLEIPSNKHLQSMILSDVAGHFFEISRTLMLESNSVEHSKEEARDLRMKSETCAALGRMCLDTALTPAEKFNDQRIIALVHNHMGCFQSLFSAPHNAIENYRVASGVMDELIKLKKVANYTEIFNMHQLNDAGLLCIVLHNLAVEFVTTRQSGDALMYSAEALRWGHEYLEVDHPWMIVLQRTHMLSTVLVCEGKKHRDSNEEDRIERMALGDFDSASTMPQSQRSIGKKKQAAGSTMNVSEIINGTPSGYPNIGSQSESTTERVAFGHNNLKNSPYIKPQTFGEPSPIAMLDKMKLPENPGNKPRIKKLVSRYPTSKSPVPTGGWHKNLFMATGSDAPASGFGIKGGYSMRDDLGGRSMSRSFGGSSSRDGYKVIVKPGPPGSVRPRSALSRSPFASPGSSTPGSQLTYSAGSGMGGIRPMSASVSKKPPVARPGSAQPVSRQRPSSAAAVMSSAKGEGDPTTMSSVPKDSGDDDHFVNIPSQEDIDISDDLDAAMKLADEDTIDISKWPEPNIEDYLETDEQVQNGGSMARRHQHEKLKKRTDTSAPVTRHVKKERKLQFTDNPELFEIRGDITVDKKNIKAKERFKHRNRLIARLKRDNRDIVVTTLPYHERYPKSLSWPASTPSPKKSPKKSPKPTHGYALACRETNHIGDWKWTERHNNHSRKTTEKEDDSDHESTASEAPMAQTLKELDAQEEAQMKFRKRRRVLRIYVKSAKDLPAVNDEGVSDPFVSIVYGKQIKTSEIAYHSVNPKWMEEFEFKVSREHSEMVIFIWDRKNLYRNDYLGKVTLNTKMYAVNKPVENEWLPMENRYETHKPPFINLDIRKEEVPWTEKVEWEHTYHIRKRKSVTMTKNVAL